MRLNRSSVLVVLGVGVAAVLVVLLTSSGASGVSPASHVAAKPSSTITGCADGPRRHDAGTVLSGSAWFTSTTDGEEVQSGHGSGGKSFAKQPILIKGDTSVVLRIPASAPRSLVMNGFGTNDAHDTMRVARLHQESDPCSGQWAAYAGGFSFKGKQCLRLQVSIDGHKTTVPFGLGKSCDARATTTATSSRARASTTRRA